MELKKTGLSGSTLKLIALVTMLIDHFGAVVVVRATHTPGFDREFWSYIYYPLRNIGRLAFPIFCFLLVEGFIHTSNVKKYFGRMVLFALISEIPFDLALTDNLVDFWFQNVFWELAVGILAMMCLQAIEKKNLNYVVQVILRLGTIVFFSLGAEIMQLDYGMYGVISIVALYVFRQKKLPQLLAGAISFCWEQVAPLAFLLIAFYNGKRGRNIKYLFYAFYPAHLLVLYFIARVMGCL